ncbi:unnamed protein product [Phaedon cochleariae]|uniref:Glycoprotein-N-acetylgalactosamine 3-beta-galactosyltransferase 1-like n=1 Tax=Phaedon cochleariae TaxID=80249 RepID=A0A9P0DQF1_PHACE|nr:unnamed protein product [Phaedon cochleariae]
MVQFYSRLTILFCGVFFGYLIAKSCIHITNKISPEKLVKYSLSYSRWFASQRFTRTTLQWDTLRYNNSLKSVIESDILRSKINVQCVVLVHNEKNAKACKATWAKSCNHVKLVQVKTKTNKPVAIKKTKENSSWVLLCQTLIELANSSDWIMVVNDSTFVIMENLRYYIAPLNADKKYYLGYAVAFWSTIYNSGQAGYVLSRGALAALQNKFSRMDCSLNSFWNREDFYLGKHLSMVNVTPMDTRDHDGYSRFHPYSWHQALFPGENYYKTSVFPTKCCSNTSISFQAIQGDKMYTFHYLLYVLQIFTDGHLGNRAPEPFDDKQVLKNFLRERNIPYDNVTSEEYYKIWERLIDDPTSFSANMRREDYIAYD